MQRSEPSEAMLHRDSDSRPVMVVIMPDRAVRNR
jgi:hypothetical protein